MYLKIFNFHTGVVYLKELTRNLIVANTAVW